MIIRSCPAAATSAGGSSVIAANDNSGRPPFWSCHVAAKHAISIGEALALNEHLALELGDLSLTILFDERLDLPLAVGLGLIEPPLHGARNANARITHARAKDLDELIDVHLRASLAQILQVR